MTTIHQLVTLLQRIEATIGPDVTVSAPDDSHELLFSTQRGSVQCKIDSDPDEPGRLVAEFENGLVLSEPDDETPEAA